jgi:hypothetical protein
MTNNKIKINNLVWIIDNGCAYTTYSDMFETLGFKNKNCNEIPEKGETGRVFGIGTHCVSKNTLYAIVNDEGKEFLMDENGVKLVKVTTIAQQLGVTKFPFSIKDGKGKEIYYELSNGFWYKYEYDDKGNHIFYKTSNGEWFKREFDDKGNVIYFEDSRGTIKGNKPNSVPEYTMEELTTKLGHTFKIKK